MADDKTPTQGVSTVSEKDEVFILEGKTVNASGHPDQLDRQYSIWSTIGLAITVDGAWIAFGGSLSLAVANGGPPGFLYELLVACFWYCWLGACLAELASALPTAGGVWHWAAIAAGRKNGRGRVVGFFAGSLNLFGWILGTCSGVQVCANIAVQLYATYHPDFLLDLQPWHTYVTYCIVTILCLFICVCGNHLLPALQLSGLFLNVVGGLVTIALVAALPSEHATTQFVWSDFVNSTGWPKFGVAFLIGCLNGAWTIGTVDAITHVAEELREPRRELPIAIASQLGFGTLIAFAYGVAISYAIVDLTAVVELPGSFPLAEIYAQATMRRQGATFGLLMIVFLADFLGTFGCFLTCTRILWSLARDNVTPYSRLLSRVNARLSCPIPVAVTVAVLLLAFGAITLGSKTAFNDLAGAFVTLTTGSYAIAIAAHLLTGRKNIPRGWFWMGSWGYPIQAITLLLTLFFNIMFCFPFIYPAETSTMNYNSVILVGILLLTTIWWFVHGRSKYSEPRLVLLYQDRRG